MGSTTKTVQIAGGEIDVEIEYEYEPLRPATYWSPAEGGIRIKAVNLEGQKQKHPKTGQVFWPTIDIISLVSEEQLVQWMNEIWEMEREPKERELE